MNKVNDEFEGEEFGDYNLFSLGGTMNKDELIEEGLEIMSQYSGIGDDEKSMMGEIISLVLDAVESPAIEALVYYADPETYFAVGFFPDPPCGDFMNDFSETDLGEKPGKKAREALEQVSEAINSLK